QCEITVDGERVHLAAFGGATDFKASLANMTTADDDIEKRCSMRLKLKAGPRQITFAFVRSSATANTMRLQPFIRSSADTFDPLRYPHLDRLELTGPFNATGPGDTPSRRAIFQCQPKRAEPICNHGQGRWGASLRPGDSLALDAASLSRQRSSKGPRPADV